MSALERCVREVEELHEFFEGWFVGRLDEAAFERFSGALAADFEIVSPAGVKTEREPLITGLREARGLHGGQADFRIEVAAPRARRAGEGLYLVTYEEWHVTSEARKGRLSTALLREAPGGPNDLEWLHVHETWLP